MAARSIATLTVSFGMVSIPVKLFSATEASRAISFNLLHKTCGSRLKQQYICVKEEVAVGREDMAKGYEFEKDQYVMFSPEELKALEEAGTHTADIAEFVPIESIDPVYFDKAYYLAPDKGGAKPYALLARALRESGRCALGRWAARGKQYIVMIRPVEDGLVMQQLLYAGEVRSIKEIEIPKTEVKDAELKLAQQLIEQQASDKFDPAAYTDEVRARPAQDVPVLIPVPDRAANRAGARCGEGPAQANHEVPERASPPPPRRDAALGPRDRRSRRPRRRLRRREPLAGGIGAVSSR